MAVPVAASQPTPRPRRPRGEPAGSPCPAPVTRQQAPRQAAFPLPVSPPLAPPLARPVSAPGRQLAPVLSAGPQSRRRTRRELTQRAPLPSPGRFPPASGKTLPSGSARRQNAQRPAPPPARRPPSRPSVQL